MERKRPIRNLRYFFAELLILIIGITVSFALNEYWQQKREQKQEVVLLKSFKNNLVNDSTVLSVGVTFMEKQTESAQKLILLSPNTVYSDSLAMNVVTLLSYIAFDPQDITYEEMKSLGNSHIIQNDSLSKQLIGLYERAYEAIAEWSSIDSEHVKGKLIPYTIDHFPFAPNLNFSVLSDKKKRQLVASVQSDEFKHLVQWGFIYKASTMANFDNGLQTIRSIIKQIDDEIGDVK